MSQEKNSQNGNGNGNENGNVKPKKNFVEVNLVANNNEYSAGRIDPTLLNAWGIAWSPTGTAWVSAQAAGISEVYNGEGGQVRPPVNIPSVGGPTGGAPTGQVFSASTTDFKLPAPNNQPARFIFVGDDGIISAWNGAAGNNAALIKNNSATASYTGLAIGVNNGANYLYAANFKSGHIEVFDKNFGSVSMSFTDPSLPSGYSPFNIQEVNGNLFVMYAKVGPDGDEVKGMGLGYVDIYSTGGSLIKRFTSGGQLNAPWGVSMAPASFFRDGNEGEDGDDDDDGQGKGKERNDIVLIGNFGNGRINAYKSDGKYFGQLWVHNAPIVIDGLWAISMAPATATTIPAGRLYFTAGPDDEADGLFGYITRKHGD
jgi:uncharacterized protein (TIGR03118 family)